MLIERSFNNSISEWKVQSKIERNSKVISLIKIQNSIPKHLIYGNLGFCLKYLTFQSLKLFNLKSLKNNK